MGVVNDLCWKKASENIRRNGMEVIAVNVLCKSKWARWGGRGLESEEKLASTLLLASFCGCKMHHVEGPSPNEVPESGSNGSIITCFFDGSSRWPSLGFLSFAVGTPLQAGP